MNLLSSPARPARSERGSVDDDKGIEVGQSSSPSAAEKGPVDNGAGGNDDSEPFSTLDAKRRKTHRPAASPAVERERSEKKFNDISDYTKEKIDLDMNLLISPVRPVPSESGLGMNLLSSLVPRARSESGGSGDDGGGEIDQVQAHPAVATGLTNVRTAINDDAASFSALDTNRYENDRPRMVARGQERSDKSMGGASDHMQRESSLRVSQSPIAHTRVEVDHKLTMLKR